MKSGPLNSSSPGEPRSRGRPQCPHLRPLPFVAPRPIILFANTHQSPTWNLPQCIHFTESHLNASGEETPVPLCPPVLMYDITLHPVAQTASPGLTLWMQLAIHPGRAPPSLCGSFIPPGPPCQPPCFALVAPVASLHCSLPSERLHQRPNAKSLLCSKTSKGSPSVSRIRSRGTFALLANLPSPCFSPNHVFSLCFGLQRRFINTCRHATFPHVLSWAPACLSSRDAPIGHTRSQPEDLVDDAQLRRNGHCPFPPGAWLCS